mgnify:CR=1 FL=1
MNNKRFFCNSFALGVPLQLTTQFFEAISFIPPFASILNTNESSEVQSEPPYWGDGLSHILILDLCPPPQDAEHVLQSLQIPQLPSTNTA